MGFVFVYAVGSIVIVMVMVRGLDYILAFFFCGCLCIYYSHLWRAVFYLMAAASRRQFLQYIRNVKPSFFVWLNCGYKISMYLRHHLLKK